MYHAYINKKLIILPVSNVQLHPLYSPASIKFTYVLFIYQYWCLHPGLVCTSIPTSVLCGTGNRRLGVCGYGLVSWCPEDWAI